MSIFKGSTKINKRSIGSTSINRVYKGSTLIDGSDTTQTIVLPSPHTYRTLTSSDYSVTWDSGVFTVTFNNFTFPTSVTVTLNANNIAVNQCGIYVTTMAGGPLGSVTYQPTDGIVTPITINLNSGLQSGIKVSHTLTGNVYNSFTISVTGVTGTIMV